MDSLRRILYIEDNPANFRLVERLLRDEGFQVLHAQDGFEGVQRAIEQREHLDLILLDINLPGMDGYEAATKLKALEGFEAIPIVAVTVNTLRGDRKRSLVAGCDGFIPKPIDIHTFPERIKDYIRGKRDIIHASDERYYLREHARKLVDRLETSIGQLRLTHEQVRHKDKLASLGEMAASIAHELNNPIASISFAIHLLLRQASEDVPERRHLELIQRNVDKIQRLAEGLTSFARPSDSERTLVQLPEILNEVVFLSEHEFRKRDIDLVCELEPQLPPVWASSSELQHIFLNLLRNAAQAVAAKADSSGNGARTGGQVQLGASTHPGEYVCVRVVDEGVGIHPEYRDRLFTPFFTTKPRGQGTGLGLYIVKEVVDALGGRIEVSSELGVGTTFCVYLPRTSVGERVN